MTESWWLKFERAQEHFKEIKRYARRYARGHPYETIALPNKKGEPNRRRFQLRVTDAPDPKLAVLIGDFVHNLRSALDHIVVASVAKKYRKSAGFPILERNPFRRDGRRFVERNPEGRNRFRQLIKGLHPDTRTFIEAVQPYHLGDEAFIRVLFILSSIENADKHRWLVTTGWGLVNPKRLAIFTDGSIDEQRFPEVTRRAFLNDGAIFHVRNPFLVALFDEGEVEVKIRGTAQVSIQIGQGGKGHRQHFPLLDTLTKCLEEVSTVLTIMEKFKETRPLPG